MATRRKIENRTPHEDREVMFKHRRPVTDEPRALIKACTMEYGIAGLYVPFECSMHHEPSSCMKPLNLERSNRLWFLKDFSKGYSVTDVI